MAAPPHGQPGLSLGDTFIGGFAAYGVFDGYDTETGYVVGAELSREHNSGATGFAQ